MFKFKYYKFFIGAIVLTASFLGLVLVSNSNTKKIDNNSLTLNTNTVKTNVVPKPLNDSSLDIKITSSRIDSGRVGIDEVTDRDGNYILTATSNNNQKAKVVKINYQMQYLYEWEYKQDTNYQTRQIVADTDDNGYFYALLVHNATKIGIQDQSNTTANNIKFTIEHPALVVQLYDTGSSFDQRNVYNLGLPNFGINNKNSIASHLADTTNTITDSQAADNIWDHIYVQEAIQETDDNSKLSFIRNTTTSNSTASDTTTTVNNVYINDNSKSVIYKLLGNSGKKDSNSAVDTSNHDYYILKQLYLNNANNMVFLKDKSTNKKMILLFGGNAYQSFWFYNFEVKTSGKSTLYVTPLLYANYDFDPFNSKYQEENLYITEPNTNTSNVMKKYFYLPFMKKNKISNLAWFVGGAKTLTISNQETNESNSYVFLAMMQPNVSDFNSSLVDNTQNSQSTDMETIKKGTFGTPEEVSSWNEQNISQTGANEPTTHLPVSQNDNLQVTSTSKYNNKDVLVSSTSNNLSYELFKPIFTWSSKSSNFKYPFSAIQSQTILPIMTSEIAASICVEPKNSLNEFPEEKIYLNTFFNLQTSSTTEFSNKFSLFNCVKTNSSTNNFKRFDFASELISTPNNWNTDIKVNTTINSEPVAYPVGIDPVGMSRILLNKNPQTNNQNFINDGWNNTASQKIIAFSPQLTSSYVKTDFGTFNQIGAVLVLRDAIYTFTYNFVQPAVGIRMVPVADFQNKVKNSIELFSSTDLQKFTNFLSISYLNNVWVVTYQDLNNSKHLCYYISYSPESHSWSLSLNSVLSEKASKDSKISKLFVSMKDNFLIIKENKSIEIANTISSKDSIILNDNPSIQANVEIWGTIKPVDQEYLSNNNLLSKTPSEIISDSDLLNQLVDYSGGWSVVNSTPSEKPLIFNVKSTSSSIIFDVALKFINGKYYSSASFDQTQYPNIIQNSLLNIPSFSYDGFATLAPWVIPAIVCGVVFLVILLILVGCFVIIALHKNKKMMQKGFASSNKKIDTLTTAVGSVYKKILTQTKNNKSPQMLKAAAKKSNVQNNSAPKSPIPPKPAANPAPKKPN
ncbi:hypothetical protein [Mycoplasmoides pirum]|uniref:hypothetical protein n=1 Tax=Mycoplasmoides pirum TaxID=2122 RepID=UPI000481B0CA|nr:hypothetical protein [Mycoplasmoides pirum]